MSDEVFRSVTKTSPPRSSPTAGAHSCACTPATTSSRAASRKHGRGCGRARVVGLRVGPDERQDLSLRCGGRAMTPEGSSRPLCDQRFASRVRGGFRRNYDLRFRSAYMRVAEHRLHLPARPSPPEPLRRWCACPESLPRKLIFRRSSRASRSFVLASLRALHLDPRLRAGGWAATGEAGGPWPQLTDVHI